MSDLLLAVPAWTAYLVAFVVAMVAPRRIGYAVAVGLTALTVPWIFLAPEGYALTIAPLGFEQTIVRIDSISRAVTAVFGFVAAVGLSYAYATGADARTNAYALSYMGSSVAAVLAGDWLTLLLAWELMAVTATVLTWQYGGEAVRPAYRYAIYHFVGGMLLTAGIGLHYAEAGTFAYGAGFTDGLPTGLAVLGVGINLGFVGLHYWVPDTYSRPHVASSVILAGFTTKVAVYALVRLVPDGNALVAWMGGAMALYGVWMALLQTDARRLLSYHIVSQVGYMTAAVGVGTALGTAGALAHLTTHVIYKGLLFMVAGAIVFRTGQESLKKLGGLGRRMPLTFVAFLVGAFAISGVPGFSGFVSKGVVTKAVESAGMDLLWWMLVLAGVGTVMSFVKFGYYAFLQPSSEPDLTRRAPPSLSFALVAAAIPSVAFGLAPDLLLGVLPGELDKITPYGADKLGKATLTTVAGIVGFAVLHHALARVRVLDVDRVLHPLAYRLADGAARTAIAIGSRTNSAAIGLIAVVDAGLHIEDRGGSTDDELALGTTLLIVVSVLGFALVVVQFG